MRRHFSSLGVTDAGAVVTASCTYKQKPSRRHRLQVSLWGNAGNQCLKEKFKRMSQVESNEKLNHST